MPTASAPTLTFSDWRCPDCQRLLGKHDGRILQVRVARRVSVTANLPATATCPGCGRRTALPSAR